MLAGRPVPASEASMLSESGKPAMHSQAESPMTAVIMAAHRRSEAIAWR